MFVVQISLGPDTNVAVTSEAGDLTAWKGDLLVLGAFEEDFETEGAFYAGYSGVEGVFWRASLSRWPEDVGFRERQLPGRFTFLALR